MLLLACSSGTGSRDVDAGSSDGGDSGSNDEARIVPEDLTVTALAGGAGVLEMNALTLRNGPDGIELYAALKNIGDVPACHAALSVELFDKTEQSLAAGIDGLLSRRFYRLTDGSETIAACVGPGDVTMSAITFSLPEVRAEDVGFLVYRCPYFALDVVPIDGLTVDRMERLERGTGTAYAGTLQNELGVTVTSPSVTVFPATRVGRPLGAAIAQGMLELPPGRSWDFTTDRVDVRGVDQFAFPAGALAE